MLRAWRFLPALFLLSLTACSFSLAGDVTPPPGFSPTEALTQSPASTEVPFVAPDPAQGALIYADQCSSCHGASGQGDGAMAAQLPNPSTALGSAEAGRTAKPVLWFATTVKGNLEKSMPGFGSSLSERQVWDVTAYTLMLSHSEKELTLGQQVFTQECQACHGAQGKGDGEKAAGLSTNPPDWSDPTRLIHTSLAEMEDTIRQGKNAAMPPFGDTLSEAQRWAAAVYVRTLTFAPGKQGAVSAAQPEGVVEATPAPAAAEGATLEASPTPNVDLSQTELTDDTSLLVAPRMHIILEFPRPGVMQVAEMLVVQNPENKMVTTLEKGKALLNFNLPKEATNLQFQDGVLGERYIQTEQGFGDTQPIPPSSMSQVLFAFDLPYTKKLSFTLNVPVAVEQVLVMVPDAAVTIKSSVLQDAGQREAQGTNIHLYVAQNAAAGMQLDMTVSGKPGQSSPDANGKNTGLVVGLAAFGLALVGVAYYLYRKQKEIVPEEAESEPQDLPTPEAEAPSVPDIGTVAVRQSERNQDALLDQIVALDEQFKAGGLAKETYQKRRMELVLRLKNLREK